MSLYDELAAGGILQYIVLARNARTLTTWDPKTQVARVLTEDGEEIDRMRYRARLEVHPPRDPEFWDAVERRIRKEEW